ncbi:MAG: hypothetical protein ABIQ30_02315 [Devosia sp.]
MADDLSFDVVNYATPIPRNSGALTLMGMLFDRVIFPGVHLPTEGYDLGEYGAELERLRALPEHPDNRLTIGVFSFLPYVKILNGFCEFTGRESDVFGKSPEQEEALLQEIELSIYGPPPSGFIPSRVTGNSKSIDKSGNAYIGYPGGVHYRAAAIIEGVERGVPIVTDEPSVAIPNATGLADGSPARAFANALALQSLGHIAPEIRVLNPEELMEFRSKHATSMRAFRGAMLRHGFDLSVAVRGVPAERLEVFIEDYVRAKIAPDLDLLREVAGSTGRRGGDRLNDVVMIGASFGTGFATGGLLSGTAAAMLQIARSLSAEVAASRDVKNTVAKNELNYLLAVERFAKR